MADPTTVYTRTAVLAWANAILGGEYASFTEVPAHELALLLYGVVSSAKGRATSLTSVSLQEIQFPTKADDTVMDATQLRNAQHALALVRKAATEAAQDATLPQLTMSDNLTAVAWVGGKAFVEELKVWRWLRALADRLSIPHAEVKRAIERFLLDGGCVSTTSEGVALAPSAHTNAVAGKEEAATPSPTHDDNNDDDAPVSTVTGRANVKRSRSRSGDGGKRESRAKAEAAKSVSALAPSTEEDEKLPAWKWHREGGNPKGTPSSSSSSIPEAATDIKWGDIPITSTGSGTAVDMLWRCQEGLVKALGTACSGDGGSGSAALEADTPRVATTTTTTTTADMAVTLLPDLAAFASAAEKQRVQNCSTCPALFATALAANLLRVEQLEASRKRAVKACLKKDMAELMSALNELA